MFWIALYSFPAIAVAVAAFLFAAWVREPTAAGLDEQGILAALTGLIWPVVAVGLVELALLVTVQTMLRPKYRPFALKSVPAQSAGRP